MPSPAEPARARLVLADVDGTLVTSDKQLTPATIEVVQQLDEAGIAFRSPPVAHLGEWKCSSGHSG